MTANELTILLHRSEGDALDFKSQQYQFANGSDEQKSELLKDIIALANAWKEGRAYLVIGVDEHQGRVNSVPGINIHLADHSMQQFVSAHTNVPLRFQVEKIDYQGVSLDVISINEKQQRPIYLKKDYGRLKKHVVYVRRGSSTAQADPDEIAEMGRFDVMNNNTISTPNIAFEFAHPKKHERWGTTAAIVSIQLDDPPPIELDPEEDEAVVDPKMNEFFRGVAKTIDLSDFRGVSFGPTLDDWIKYMKQNARFISVSFWMQNIGLVNASNIHAEIRIEKQDGLFILEGHLRPLKPKPLMATGIIYTDHSIDMRDDGNTYVMTLDAGTLQPQIEYWPRRTFIVAAKSDRKIPVHVKIFADDLARPQELTLFLNVAVVARNYTDDDLSAVKKGR